MFGFEPEDDVYHKWWKWEARQRTLRILKTTDKQPIRSNTGNADRVKNEGHGEDFVDGNAATTNGNEILDILGTQIVC